jgi:outer membrane biosynthesis protein TonB
VVFEQIHSAYELIKQGRLREARLFLESSRDSEFLNEEEIGQITEGLRRINERLNEQRMQIDELYRRSMEFYNAGDFEKARAGIAQIDGILAQLCDPAAPAEAEAVEQPAEAAVEVTEKELVDVATEAIQETEPGVPAEPNEQTKPVVETEPAETIEPVAKAEPVTVGQPAEPAVVESTESKAAAEDSSRKKADRRRNLVRRYTEVVVNDAIMTAQNSLSQGELAEALKMVETADRVVKTNQVDLGEELFSEYEIMLKRLTKEIVEQQSEGSR